MKSIDKKIKIYKKLVNYLEHEIKKGNDREDDLNEMKSRLKNLRNLKKRGKNESRSW